MVSHDWENKDFFEQLKDLMLWRRDVRHFKSDKIPPQEEIMECLAMACKGPSVGNSQPWRFVLVDDVTRREDIYSLFKQTNSEALENYKGEKANQYAQLKLQGIKDAPVQISVFADIGTSVGHGLGSQTMPESKAYSVVAAIQILWLLLRAKGIGLGWVSILPPLEMAQTLEIDDSLTFIGHLCIGYPKEESMTPELVKEGWQDRLPPEEFIIRR